MEAAIAEAALSFVAGNFSFVAAFAAEGEAAVCASALLPEKPEGLSAGAAAPRHDSVLIL